LPTPTSLFFFTLAKIGESKFVGKLSLLSSKVWTIMDFMSEKTLIG